MIKRIVKNRTFFLILLIVLATIFFVALNLQKVDYELDDSELVSINYTNRSVGSEQRSEEDRETIARVGDLLKNNFPSIDEARFVVNSEYSKYFDKAIYFSSTREEVIGGIDISDGSSPKDKQKLKLLEDKNNEIFYVIPNEEFNIYLKNDEVDEKNVSISVNDHSYSAVLENGYYQIKGLAPQGDLVTIKSEEKDVKSAFLVIENRQHTKIVDQENLDCRKGMISVTMNEGEYVVINTGNDRSVQSLVVVNNENTHEYFSFRKYVSGKQSYTINNRVSDTSLLIYKSGRYLLLNHVVKYVHFIIFIGFAYFIFSILDIYQINIKKTSTLLMRLRSDVNKFFEKNFRHLLILTIIMTILLFFNLSNNFGSLFSIEKILALIILISVLMFRFANKFFAFLLFGLVLIVAAFSQLGLQTNMDKISKIIYYMIIYVVLGSIVSEIYRLIDKKGKTKRQY